MSNRAALIALVIAIGLALAIGLTWQKKHPKTVGPQTASTEDNSNLNENFGDAASIDYDGTPYGIDEDTGEFYKEEGGIRTVITTPFELAAYHGKVLGSGTIFWRRGPDASAKVDTFDEPYTYEDGVAPDFQWYDAGTKKFTTLQNPTLTKEGTKFERVYDVFASVSEPKLVVEVGEFDTASSVFPPGLVDEQPVKTHGVLYDLATRTIIDGDPITAYHDALNATSTLFLGMSWDSRRNLAVAVPGGEGCGSYDVIRFVDLQTKAVKDAGGPGSFDFTKEDCNPSNTVSPDDRWFVLYGKAKSGKRLAVLFNHEHGTTPVKQVTFPKAEADDEFAEIWDLTKTYPIVTFTGGTVVDFNI